jgi:hypothetical protein
LNFFFHFFLVFGWGGGKQAKEEEVGREGRGEKRRESEMERKEKVETGIDCCLEKSVR